MSNWTAFDFKRKLVAQVKQTNFDPPDVRILTYYPSPNEPVTDGIIIGHTLADTKEQSNLAGSSSNHDEEVNVECQIRVVRPGAGEETAQAAEDRAEALLAVVDTQVRTDAPKVGVQRLSANLSSRDAAMFAWEVGDGVAARLCVIDFVITYRART